MSKKIYIAGKVTGEPIAECTMKFGSAQKQVEALGFEAINPLAVVGSWDVSWETAMKRCIKALMDCDGIFILPCSNESEGAMIERNLANILKIKQFSDLKSLKHYEWNS
jgi:Domain of unknown function (DUF4406)